MLSDTWLLMRLYWTIDRRTSRQSRAWQIIITVGLIAGGLAAAVFSGLLGYGMGALVTRLPETVPFEPGTMPGILLTMVMLGVLLTGLNQAVRALFLSGDLERLMVAPIHSRSVMVAKLLSRMPWNVLLLLVLAAPALVMFGIGIGAGPLYFASGAILLILAPLFGLSVGALLAMVLVRFLPVKRLSELLAAAYALIGIMIGLAFQLPRFLANDNFSEEGIDLALGGAASTINDLPLPSIQAGQAMLDFDSGHFAAGLGNVGFYILITLGLFLFTVLASDWLYLSGWLRSQGASMRRKGLETEPGALGGRSIDMAIAVKDWLMRVRDPRQIVSLLGGGLIAIVVSALALFRGTGDAPSLLSAAQSSPDIPSAFAFFGALFSPGVLISGWILMIGWAIFSNIATFSLPLEGKSFAVLKVAPVRPERVWRGKLSGVFVPYAVASTLMLAVAWFLQRFSAIWTPYAWVCIMVIGFGLMVTGISSGYVYANLDWDDPRRMTTQRGGMFAFLLSIFYGLPLVVVAALTFAAAQTWTGATPIILIVGLGILGGATWLWTKWQLRRAVRAWDKLPAE